MNKKLALVVEDCKSVWNMWRLVIREKLLESGFEFEFEYVQSGEEALEKIRKNQRYDIIFMDGNLCDYGPGKINGVEVVKIIRTLNTKVPILMTSNSIPMCLKGVEAGANGYVCVHQKGQTVEEIIKLTQGD